MSSLFKNKPVLLLLLLFGGGNFLYSQTAENYYYDNEFDLSFPVKNNWSMEVGFGNRGKFLERLDGEKVSGYQHQHLELNHFTNYSTGGPLVLSLGLRYRFKDLFDDTATDEFRIIEQLGYTPLNSLLNFSHRFRLEQRFTEHTIHRVRYRLGTSRPLNEVFSLKAATEALYGVSATLKPEAEQRFSVGVENSSYRAMKLGLTFEYRMENYARNLEHDFFVVTGVSYALD